MSPHPTCMQTGAEAAPIWTPLTARCWTLTLRNCVASPSPITTSMPAWSVASISKVQSLTLPPHTTSHYLTPPPHTTSHHLLTPPHTTSSRHLTLPPHTTSHHLTLPHTTSSHHFTLPPHTTSHYLLTPPHTTSHYLLTPPHTTSSHHLTLPPHATSHYLLAPLHTTFPHNVGTSLPPAHLRTWPDIPCLHSQCSSGPSCLPKPAYPQGDSSWSQFSAILLPSVPLPPITPYHATLSASNPAVLLPP